MEAEAPLCEQGNLIHHFCRGRSSVQCLCPLSFLLDVIRSLKVLFLIFKFKLMERGINAVREKYVLVIMIVLENTETFY